MDLFMPYKNTMVNRMLTKTVFKLNWNSFILVFIIFGCLGYRT